MTPDVHYAKGPEGQVAYQVTGGGPVDIVFVPDWVTNLEVMWEEAAIARFLERLAMSPSVFAGGYQVALNADVRPILETIRVPTLVLHRTGNRFIRVGNGRYLAEHIARAKFVELPGDDHFFYAGDVEAMLAPIEEFLTGARTVVDDDRVLATVLFTDIVGCTQHDTRLRDRAWRDLLERHGTAVRQELGGN